MVNQVLFNITKHLHILLEFYVKTVEIYIGLTGKTVDNSDINIDLPTINIKDYVNDNLKLYKNRKITDEQIKLIDLGIKNNYTKKEFSELLQVSQYYLLSLIAKYDKIKPGIQEAFNKAIKIGRKNVLLDLAIQRSNMNSNVNSKINRIKLEKGMSNKDIISKCKGKLSIAQLVLIIEGKVEPKPIYKELIARALDEKIENIF